MQKNSILKAKNPILKPKTRYSDISLELIQVRLHKKKPAFVINIYGKKSAKQNLCEKPAKFK